MKLKTIKNWLHDSSNADQEQSSKQRFVLSGKTGPSLLDALGISNKKLKKFALQVYRVNKDEDFDKVLEIVDALYDPYEYYEEVLLALFILEKYRREFDKSLFDHIVENWLHKIDHWAVADHMSINVFKHFPVLEEEYQKVINSWAESDNFWLRRLSITAYLQAAREDKETLDPLLNNMEKLMDDDNHYIQKAIPWMLKEATRKIPGNRSTVTAFIEENIEHFNKGQLRESIKHLSQSDQGTLFSAYEDQN